MSIQTFKLTWVSDFSKVNVVIMKIRVGSLNAFILVRWVCRSGASV